MSLLEQALSDPEHAAFQQLFKDFESQKVCYLPLTSLILKPLHRLLHYELLVERKHLVYPLYTLRRLVIRKVLSTRIWGVPPAGGPLLHVATYSPSRLGELPKFVLTKPCE